MTRAQGIPLPPPSAPIVQRPVASAIQWWTKHNPNTPLTETPANPEADAYSNYGDPRLTNPVMQRLGGSDADRLARATSVNSIPFSGFQKAVGTPVIQAISGMQGVSGYPAATRLSSFSPKDQGTIEERAGTWLLNTIPGVAGGAVEQAAARGVFGADEAAQGLLTSLLGTAKTSVGVPMAAAGMAAASSDPGNMLENLRREADLPTSSPLDGKTHSRRSHCVVICRELGVCSFLRRITSILSRSINPPAWVSRLVTTALLFGGLNLAVYYGTNGAYYVRPGFGAIAFVLYGLRLGYGGRSWTETKHAKTRPAYDKPDAKVKYTDPVVSDWE